MTGGRPTVLVFVNGDGVAVLVRITHVSGLTSCSIPATGVRRRQEAKRARPWSRPPDVSCLSRHLLRDAGDPEYRDRLPRNNAARPDAAARADHSWRHRATFHWSPGGSPEGTPGSRRSSW